MNHKDYTLIGKRIQLNREMNNLSQASLAEMTDLSVSYISYLENGKKRPSLETITKIALALNTSVDALLHDANTGTDTSYNIELSHLLSDCDQTERRFLIDFVSLAKVLFRKYRKK